VRKDGSRGEQVGSDVVLEALDRVRLERESSAALINKHLNYAQLYKSRRSLNVLCRCQSGVSQNSPDLNKDVRRVSPRRAAVGQPRQGLTPPSKTVSSTYMKIVRSSATRLEESSSAVFCIRKSGLVERAIGRGKWPALEERRCCARTFRSLKSAR
jgi:hypothetical protein